MARSVRLRDGKLESETNPETDGCGMGDLSAHDAGRCGPGCDLEV